METVLIPKCLDNIKDLFYEPSEDTFLLLDVLEEDLEALKHAKPLICLEIGCGSGVVISSLAKALGKESIYLATDINSHACSASKQTASTNNVQLDVINTNLVSAVFPRLKNKVDILLFNPPYVTTESSEVGAKDISAAWAGGANGREVMNAVFPVVNELLTSSGVFYLVTLKENDPDDVARCLKQYGLTTVVACSRRCGVETLFVLKIQRTKNF